MLTLEKIYKASEVLKEVAGKTDILPASKIFCDNHIFLKTENIQSTGSFKVRGRVFQNFRADRGRKETRRHSVLRRQPRAGSRACGDETRREVPYMPARGRSHKQNSGDKGLRRGRVSRQGRLRRRLSEGSRTERTVRLHFCPPLWTTRTLLRDRAPSHWKY